MENSTGTRTEREQTVFEHCDVLDKIEKLLEEYEPTKDMGLLDALRLITKDLRKIPAEETTDKIADFRERHGLLLKEMPDCVCPDCLREAGLESIVPASAEFIGFLNIVEDVLKRADMEGIENFSGYSVCALFEKEKDR